MRSISIILTCFAITIFFSSCGGKKYISMIHDSNKKTLKKYYKEQIRRNDHFHYRRKCDNVYKLLVGYNGEWENMVENRLDSLIGLIVLKTGYDTIYYRESEGNSLLSYYGTLWKKDGNVYIFCNDDYFDKCESIEDMPDSDRRLILLLQEFDEKKIHSLSHSRPLIHHGSETRIESVNRFIFKNGKCIDVETIFYSEIDMRSNATPTLF